MREIRSLELIGLNYFDSTKLQNLPVAEVLLSDLYTVEAGQWNGMISNLINGEADLIAAPVTKCCKRTKVIDFFGSFIIQSQGFAIKRKYLLCVFINQAIDLWCVNSWKSHILRYSFNQWKIQHF